MQFDIFGASPGTPDVKPPRSAGPPTASKLLILRLLDAAYEALGDQPPFHTPGEAAAWGTTILGVDYTPGGPWTLDDVYDALEGAAHKRIAGEVAGLGLAERVRVARDHEERWFKGRALTDAARAQAQFSTPLPIAEGVAHLLRVAGRVRTVMEPCAGTGSLLRPLLDAHHLALHANELDPRRRHVLAWLGVRASDRDALKLPLDPARFDAFVSNPPFGAYNRGNRERAGRGATDFALSNMAQRFAAAHLRSLRPNGLLVALLPASTLSDAGADFRRWLRENHSPLLYLQCPEGSYRSRGAFRDAMLLVLRHGRSADTPTHPEVVSSPSWDGWTEAVDHLAGLLAAAASPPEIAPTPGSAPPAVQHALLADLASRSAGGAAPTPATPPTPTPPRQSPPAPAPRPAATTEGEAKSNRPEAATDPRRSRAIETTLDIDFGTLAPAPRATADWDRAERERADTEASAIFTPFNVSLRERRAPHPRLVVETRSMAGMPAPPVIRQGFKSPVADDAWGRSGDHGGASDEQAELALRVLDAWDRGHGFLCADDVGVGKSREIALLALEAIHEGATRIIVTTKNETNVRDLERELKRVASGHQHGPFPAQFVEVSNYTEAKGDAGVLPCPLGPTIYLAHSYNFADFMPALRRVNPTVWLADEAHEYSNVGSSKRGIAWTELHEYMLAYTSRIAYFTATPAVTLDELCYLYALRLWKVGTFERWMARKTGKSSAEREERSGEAEAAVAAHVSEAAGLGDTAGVEADQSAADGKRRFMVKRNDAFTIRTTPAETEQVMRELRGSGHYLSRDLWRGGVTFEIEWIDLLADPLAVARYNEAARLCRDISFTSRKFGVMNEKVKTAGFDRAMIQSYLKQLLFDLRLDTILACADAALAEGRQVVVSVHSVAGDDEGTEAIGGDSEAGCINRRLESAINRINVREIRKDGEDGETDFIDLGDIPEAILAREELRERARALIPLRDPVRLIEQHYGASKVAAITGRIPAKLRTLRMGEFQAGICRFALISQAGKIGISLHDVNGVPRYMLIADYEWSAEMFKQELGRVDRTGQLSSPWLALAASRVPGERKFASTISARMASLGATCKGSAESTGTDALEIFDMSGGIALEAMKNAVERLDDHTRSFFTGSQFLERQKTKSGADVWTPKHRPDEGTQMRHFLLEMLLFPIEEASTVLALWEEERDKLLTEETLAAQGARRTNRIRGTVLRERELPIAPPITLVDVTTEDDDSLVIAQGFVTEHMIRIQQARGPASDGTPRTRRYIQFTSEGGKLVSGLELTPTEAHRVRWAFGQYESRANTPESILEDLKAGEKVRVNGHRGATWKLHLRREGRIEIRGAKISRDRPALNRPELKGIVAYEPAGNFLHLTSHDALRTFLEHFPMAELAEELKEAA